MSCVRQKFYAVCCDYRGKPNIGAAWMRGGRLAVPTNTPAPTPSARRSALARLRRDPAVTAADPAARSWIMRLFERGERAGGQLEQGEQQAPRTEVRT